MASRFPRQRDPRAASSLFDSYSGEAQSHSHPASRSPSRVPGGYRQGGYPGGGVGEGYPPSDGAGAGGYRTATPNSKGHYSDSVLSSLESQNEAEVEGISAKVKMLKNITVAIGDEIRDTSNLTDLNDSFDSTRMRVRGNMTRMLRMAQRTGVGWKVWLVFLGVVFFLFFYVWIT